MAGPGGDAYAVVLSLGLGLTVLATIGQIDANLRQTISGALPQIAPAYFVVDIQSTDRDAFVETATEGGAARTETAPMLRGILTRINGQPAREVAGSHWVLRGERGVTYSDDPAGAEITEGAWWEAGYTGPPLVSFAEEEGRELGLAIGDRITVNLLGRDIEAEIANFRTVDFSDMGINFLMVMNEAALRGAPHSHIATLYAETEKEGQILRTIAEAFPTVTAIRTRDAIARAADTVGTIATAISLERRGNPAHGLCRSDRGGRRGRAASGLRGRGPEDARRDPFAHPCEFRVAGGDPWGRRRFGRRCRGRVGGLGRHDIRDDRRLPVRTSFGGPHHHRRDTGEPSGGPSLRHPTARSATG